MKRTIIKYLDNHKTKKEEIEIPKELEKYYDQDVEDIINGEEMGGAGQGDAFLKLLLLLHRHKEISANGVIKAIEYYNSDFDGENCHAECICGISKSSYLYCPDSHH